MSSERRPALTVEGLSKSYYLYNRPLDRLKQYLLPRRKYGREFRTLRDISFSVQPGEVLGLVGRNGAGKSTLLQIICGTIRPTAGSVAVNGRIAALLELGAGFNPEFTGRENVYLNAALLGLTPAQIEERFDEIVSFSGVADFLDQPVKTYSSGMYVRLAFSIATSVSPDILVVDEALSVGDGEFARKSFDRIMSLKDAGKTILFCSHSLYQIEALCSSAIWLEKGEIRAAGNPAEVVRAYGAFLDRESAAVPNADERAHAVMTQSGRARIERVETRVDGECDRTAHSRESTVEIRVDYHVVDAEDLPSVAVAFYSLDGKCLASVSSHNDNIELLPDGDGRVRVRLVFPELPLLKGFYTYDVWLFCSRGLFAYEHVRHAGRIEVVQSGLEQGVVTLPHSWET